MSSKRLFKKSNIGTASSGAARGGDYHLFTIQRESLPRKIDYNKMNGVMMAGTSTSENIIAYLNENYAIDKRNMEHFGNIKEE